MVKVPAVKPAANPNEIPKEPVKGLEEEYANALYAMGKYDLARAAYQRIIESKPKADILAWARLQVGELRPAQRRSSGGRRGLRSADELRRPTSPWADEAAWWAGEIKWWILWDQSTK